MQGAGYDRLVPPNGRRREVSKLLQGRCSTSTMRVMAALLTDHEITERVLSHIANRSTDVGDELWREPVENYRSQQRFEAETERVLRRSYAAFCPSAALPEAGSFIARDAAGMPVVAVRGQDGVVRAFQNVCRHRGMRVASDSGCANAFVCPYHGWTYELNGRLRHIPHAEGFPGLDKEQHGLAPLRCGRAPRSGVRFAGAGRSSGRSRGPARAHRQGSDALRDERARDGGQLEDRARRFPRGLPHPCDASGELLPLWLRQPQRRRAHRSAQSRDVPVPAHREARRGAAGRAARHGLRDLRLPHLSQCAGHRALEPYQPARARAAERRSHATSLPIR